MLNIHTSRQDKACHFVSIDGSVISEVAFRSYLCSVKLLKPLTTSCDGCDGTSARLQDREGLHVVSGFAQARHTKFACVDWIFP